MGPETEQARRILVLAFTPSAAYLFSLFSARDGLPLGAGAETEARGLLPSMAVPIPLTPPLGPFYGVGSVSV